jgi:hypothetical protein
MTELSWGESTISLHGLLYNNNRLIHHLLKPILGYVFRPCQRHNDGLHSSITIQVIFIYTNKGTFELAVLPWNKQWVLHPLILCLQHSSSSSLPGPETYTSAAPQPAGLLCNPDLDVPPLTASLLYETLAARGGIIYRHKDVTTLSTSSALLCPLSRESWSYRPLIWDFYQLSTLVFKRS